MGWRDLLSANESLVLPWTGGRHLRVDERFWSLEGKVPREHTWARFLCKTNRTAELEGPSEVVPEKLKYPVKGYLVGNRLVSDRVQVNPDPLKIAEQTEEVYLVEPGLDRFARVSAGRMFEGGPLIYRGPEFPLGPENEVMKALFDGKVSSLHIQNVHPALDAAFRMELWQREEARRRRAAIERRRQEEEALRAQEEKRQAIIKQLGDGAGRRELAAEDFETAARAALAVGGAVYLDHRASTRRNEMVVKFRLENRQFECTCDKALSIIDSGICLTAHYNDRDFEGGTKGDTWLTLESLPGVILQAQRERKLVVYRHVDEGDDDD